MATRRRLLNFAGSARYIKTANLRSSCKKLHSSQSSISPKNSLSLCLFRIFRESIQPKTLHSSLDNESRCWSSQSNAGEARKCWACEKEASGMLFLVCPSCQSVQQIDHSINYFQIFDIEPRFDIDPKYLEKKYKDWQKQLHPDLFQSKSEQDKKNSSEQSALVIRAYNVLLNPLSRAKYLIDNIERIFNQLQLKGIHVNEEETVSNPALLMEILELQESVHETNDAAALKPVQSEIEAKLEQCQAHFKTAYKEHDFRSAVSAIQQMSYYKKVKEEIIKKL